MKTPAQPDSQSLAGFVLELSRRRSLRFAAHLDGESRDPLPSVLYRVYQSPYTLEHRTVIRILKAIVRNSSQSELSENEIVALSPDMLHLLHYLISDYKELRYSTEEVSTGIAWLEDRFRDLGT